MIGIECNSNNEVIKVINKLAFISNINEALCKKLVTKIYHEATKVGYPVIIIKNFDKIEYAFGNDVKDDIDIISYEDYYALNLFKKVPSKHVNLLLDYMSYIPNNASIKTIKLVLEEYQNEIENKTDIENKKYSAMVGKYFLLEDKEEEDFYYIKVLEYDPSTKHIFIDYAYSSIFCQHNVSWHVSYIDFFKIKEITKEKYESIIKQYADMLSTLSDR